MEQQIWKVFFPHSCWRSPSGLLIGVKNHKQSSVIVTAVLQLVRPQGASPVANVNRHLEDIAKCASDNKLFQVLGLWVNDEQNMTLDIDKCKRYFKDEDMFVVLKKARKHSMPECCLERQNTRNESVIAITFDSSVECLEINYHLSNKARNGKVVDHVIEVVHDWSLLKCCFNVALYGQVHSRKKRCIVNSFHAILTWLFALLLLPIHIIGESMKSIFSLGLFQIWILDVIVCFPATGCQLKEKYKRLQECLALNRVCEARIREVNLVLGLLVDVSLGILLIGALYQCDFSNLLTNVFMNFARKTAASLEGLLHWLMGAPAGLKLNRELASFLGNFFLYHIYLWVGYLNTIAPFLAPIIWFASLSGCLGLTVIVAIASDVMSLLTFHVYCFYVYAARIYCLQINGLLAFWRLFRGKKWNVLRQRVDSCAFHMDQLFLGTLLFTILLFLLPTTALFYSVFTLLRLGVLISQSIIAKTIVVLNTVPYYSMLLWFSGASSVMDGICFQAMSSQEHPSHSWLLLKMKPMLFVQVFKSNSLSTKDTSSISSWKDLGLDLLSGHLVYPWGRKKTNKRDKMA